MQAATDLVVQPFVQKHSFEQDNLGFHVGSKGTSLYLQSFDVRCFVVFKKANDLMACLNFENLELIDVKEHCKMMTRPSMKDFS